MGRVWQGWHTLSTAGGDALGRGEGLYCSLEVGHMWRAALAGILGAGVLVSPAQAQLGLDVPVGGGPYDPARVGIPMGAQIIDVRWSGDRRGEVTLLTTLPPAFRRPADRRNDPPAPFRERTGVRETATIARSPLRYDPRGPDRDCEDFGTWQEAQAFYEAAGGPDEDRHRLDTDRDGIACESLPGAPGRRGR